MKAQCRSAHNHRYELVDKIVERIYWVVCLAEEQRDEHCDFLVYVNVVIVIRAGIKQNESLTQFKRMPKFLNG